jgi:hypothetical protein
MTLTLTPYQEQALLQAISDSLTAWDDRIDQALLGERPNLSIDGALLLIEDLREVQKQMLDNR